MFKFRNTTLLKIRNSKFNKLLKESIKVLKTRN